MKILNNSEVKNLILSQGFGFKLDEDDSEDYNYDFSNILDQIKYNEHPLKLHLIFTSNHKLTNYSNQNTSSIQNWYFTKEIYIKNGLFSKTVYAVFVPHYTETQTENTPKICIELDVIKKFMIGMQNEFPEKFSPTKLKRVIGLNS